MTPDSAAPTAARTESGDGFSAARDHAIARLGHAVRTPLSIVVASVEMMGDASGDPGSATRIRMLADAVARLRRLLDHLLVVSRWPTDDAAGATSLGDALRRATERTMEDAAARQVEIDVPVVDPVDVVAHQEVLVWALTALIERAVAEVDGGGRIVLDVSPSDDSCVAVTIAPRPDDDRTGHDAATGATPDVVAELAAEVLAHGWGDVRLGSDPDGTTTVVIPTAATSARPPASSPEVGEHRTTEQVPDPIGPDGAHVALVVEDDTGLRELLTRTLSADWRVVAAASAEQALAAARRHRPVVIVCDIMLPGIDGEQLVHSLQGLDPLAEVPIIVLSGRTDEALRIRLLRDGADDYLTKPFSVAELQVRMANLASDHLDLDELRRRADEAETLALQLQHALDSRIVIEQAKAFVAAAVGIDVAEAFEQIRSHARSNHLRLRDVAREVVDSRQWPPL